MNQLKLPKFSQILHTTAFHNKEKNTNNTNKQHHFNILSQGINWIIAYAVAMATNSIPLKSKIQKLHFRCFGANLWQLV